MRAARAIVGPSVALLVGCGAAPASTLAKAPEFQPKDQTKCSVEKSQAKPLIVEWPSADRGQMEARAHGRGGIVVVRYQGCEMQVLDRCTAAVRYGYVPITRKKDRVAMRDADDLYANVPVGAARLEATLARSGELDVDMTLVGRWEAERASLHADELQGECSDATHVVAAITVGAFSFTSGADAKVGGGGGFMGVGAGAQSSSSREVLSADGDATACEKATPGDTNPPPECGAVIRLEVVPLSPGKSAAGSASQAAAPSPAANVSPAAPAAVQQAPAVAATGRPPFDVAAAGSALGSVDVSGCKSAGGPTGAGKARISFAPDGSVLQVYINDPPYAGTPTGGCIAGKLRAVRIPAYTGGVMTVGKSFVIQ